MTPGKTFVSLYENLCAGSLELFKQFASKLGRTRLVATFVGPAKDNLSAVDSKLPVDKVCRQFGSFTRLKCEKIEADSASTSSDVDDPVQPNAFQVLLINQRALSSILPARLEPRNNKDKLFNDLVLLFEKKDWKWRDGGDTHRKKSISNLCDVLCYRWAP